MNSFIEFLVIIQKISLRRNAGRRRNIKNPASNVLVRLEEDKTLAHSDG